MSSMIEKQAEDEIKLASCSNGNHDTFTPLWSEQCIIWWDLRTEGVLIALSRSRASHRPVIAQMVYFAFTDAAAKCSENVS